VHARSGTGNTARHGHAGASARPAELEDDEPRRRAARAHRRPLALVAETDARRHERRARERRWTDAHCDVWQGDHRRRAGRWPSAARGHDRRRALHRLGQARALPAFEDDGARTRDLERRCRRASCGTRSSDVRARGCAAASLARDRAAEVPGARPSRAGRRPDAGHRRRSSSRVRSDRRCRSRRPASRRT